MSLYDEYLKSVSAPSLKKNTRNNEEKLRRFSDMKKEIEEQGKEIDIERKKIEKKLAEIVGKEEEIEKREKGIREREESAKTVEEKKSIALERREAEEKRREIEQERWQQEDEIKKIKQKEEEIVLQYQYALNEEEKIKREKERSRFEIERDELEKELGEIEKLKETIENKKEKIALQKQEIEKTLEEILSREKTEREKKESIEEKESFLEMGTEEKRKAEQERADVEEKIRKIEEERWQCEEKMEEIKGQEKEIGLIIEREKRTRKKIGEINAIITGVEIEEEIYEPPAKAKEEKPLPEKKPVAEKPEAKADASKTEEKTGSSAPSAPAPASGSVPAPPPIKERDMGMSMEERLAQARKRIEEMSKKRGLGEEEKSAEQSPEPEEDNPYLSGDGIVSDELKKEEKKTEQISPAKPPAQEGVQESPSEEVLSEEPSLVREELLKKLKQTPAASDLPEASSDLSAKEEEAKEKSQDQGAFVVEPALSVPSKPASSKKLEIRIVFFTAVIIIALIIAGLLYWFLAVRTKSPVVIEPVKKDAEEEPILPKPEPPIEVFIPEPPFEFESIEQFEIYAADAIPLLLASTLKDWSAEEANTFKRINIIDVINKKTIGLKDFFNALYISMPSSFFDNAGEDIFLFSYSHPLPGQNRLGFITKASDELFLSNMLKDREKTLIDDFETFFFLMEEAIEGFEAPIANSFKNAKDVSGYEGQNFRYLTLAKEDFGICYAVVGGHFVFTSSWQSMENVLKKLLPPVKTN